MLQVFSHAESVIDRWVVGVRADISPGALLRKSRPVDIVWLGVMDGLLIIVSEAVRWRQWPLLTSCWRLVELAELVLE